MKKRMTGTLLCAALAVAIVMAAGVGAETALAVSPEDDGDSAQQTESEDEGNSTDSIFEGPYELKTLDGQKAVGYEVTNTTEDNIYIGLMVEFTDRFNENIGISSAFIPCIAPGDSAYIYAVDNCIETSRNYTAMPFYGTSNYVSAEEDISELSVTEEDDFVSFSIENTTDEVVYLPQISVVYQLNSNPVAIYSGVFLDEDGNSYLDAGSTGSVKIGCPEEYDDYNYWITAYYDPSYEVKDDESEDIADSSEETEQSERFVAQGKVSLMNFLAAAGDNGYSIESPNRNGNTVTAIAVGPDKSYSMQYTVQDQRIYGFGVFAGSESEVSSDGFMNCIIGLAKALNSNLDDETIKSAVEEAIANPDTQVIHDDTLYRYFSATKQIAVSR